MWVPPKVSAENLRARRQQEAELAEMLVRKAELDGWSRELKQIDEHLELVWAPESAKAVGLTPGRYHVMRHNPGAPPSLIPITGPEGEYLEPGSQVFDRLRAADLWHDEAARDQKHRQEALDRAKEKASQVEREELHAELNERLRSANNGSIHVTGLPYKEN